MYIEPADDWHTTVEGFELERLNFTWNCTRYERDKKGSFTTLYVDLKFHHPADISPFAEQDSVFVNLTKAVELQYIQSINGVALRKEDYIMRQKVRLQMEKSESTE